MELVKYTLENHIATIVINRPEALNAINPQVVEELDSTLTAISEQDVRCVILTGAGEKAFVAGADISVMSEYDKGQAEHFGKRGNDVFRKLETLSVPVIAAINGFALGGGCELALSCDIRIASETAVFAQPEVSLGITPGFGGTQRLARAIGVGKAKEMLYTGNKIKAHEALSLGLVNAVYPCSELMEQAQKLAIKIASNAPIAVRATKKAVNDGLQVDMDSAIVIEERLFASCFETQDQIGAMTAFVEKRKPEPFINK